MPRPARRRPDLPLVAAACLAVAALSLLGPHQPTYDPWAWLVWGRDIAHGRLDTMGGPTWKPLPVLFTVPFSLAGDAAPQLWLVVARAGFLLGCVAAFRLARSLAGPWAGALAAVGVVLVDRFVALAARGASEGLLVATALGAVERHRAGRRGEAFALGLAAGLIRPEIWPFAAAYGLWLVAQRADRLRALAPVAFGGILLLALWFVPERLGSDSALRGASRARSPVEGSPAQADHPFIAVFTNSSGAVVVALYVGAVLSVLLAVQAWRRRRGGLPPRPAAAGDPAFVGLLAAAATVYMVIVALLAEAGFTGNERYVLLPASVVCVLGGAGLVAIVRLAAGRGAPRAVLAVLALAGVASCLLPAQHLGRQLRDVRRESRLYDRLDDVIGRAGGRAAVLRCGRVFSDPFETQVLLWHLELRGRAIAIHPRPPGTIVAPEDSEAAMDDRFGLRAAGGGWVVRSTCPGDEPDRAPASAQGRQAAGST